MLPNSITFEGFRGAIQKVLHPFIFSLISCSLFTASFQIILNDQPLNEIRQDAVELYNISAYHGYPCQPNPCTLNEICRQTDLNNYTCHLRSSQGQTKDMSVELDGRLNLVYPYVPSNLNRNYFKLAVRTTNSFGLIFYIGDTTSVFSQYLSLTLVNGFVQFTAKIDRNASEIFLISKVRLDDGQWHRIELERFVHRHGDSEIDTLSFRFRRRITMKINDHYPRRTVSASLQTEFRPFSTSMYVGGYHRLCGQNEQHCRTYRGCLKNFLLDKSHLDFFHDEINQHHSLQTCQPSAG